MCSSTNLNMASQGAEHERVQKKPPGLRNQCVKTGQHNSASIPEVDTSVSELHRVGFDCHLTYVFNTISQMPILCLSLADPGDEPEQIGRESS